MKYLTMIFLFAMAGSVNAEYELLPDLAKLLVYNEDMSTWPRADAPERYRIRGTWGENRACDMSNWCEVVPRPSSVGGTTWAQWMSEHHRMIGRHVYECNTLNHQPSCDEVDWYFEQRAI